MNGARYWSKTAVQNRTNTNTAVQQALCYPVIRCCPPYPPPTRRLFQVPNMRHLRAMRSAPTPADSFPLGVGGTFHNLHNNQGRLSSPRASGVSIDTGDTPTSSPSLGDGSSSLPPLGQLTPRSLPPQEEEFLEVGTGVASQDPAAGAFGDAAASRQSPPELAASPSGNGSDNQGRKNTPTNRKEGNGNVSSLVHLRGSPNGESEVRTTPFSVVGGQGQQRIVPPPHSPTSPIGASSSVRVTRGVAAGVAAGAAAGVAASGKRKRPAAAGANPRSVTTNT